MKRYLFDTGIAGAFMNRRQLVVAHAKEAVAQGHRIGIGVPVLAELYYGVEFSETRDRNLQRLRGILSRLTIWPFTEVAAARYGQIAAQLRRVGRKMQQVDMMVAATAMTLPNCSVVSTDSDLKVIPGLLVEDWSIPQAPSA